MVEDDTFTYHVKQQSANQRDTAAHSLITKERTQKLDLLIHLLSNLPQALVVCGPEGIGKTTLLEILQQRKTELWRYCLVQGNADLSFEAVHGQLAQAQSSRLGRNESQHKQTVLIVDNAGELVPGLITAIIRYATVNPDLKVIFALTHDELQVKRGSDRAIDDCHIVEIPPLSEKQCGDFLQYLSAKPYANLSFKAIGETMIAHIYRETHGVPGRIIAEISGLSGAKQSGKLKWILALAATAAIVIAMGVQWLVSSPKNNKEIAAPASVEHKAENIEVVPSRPADQIMLSLPPAQPVAQPQSVPANEGKEQKSALEPSAEINTHKNDQLPVASIAKPELDSPAIVKPLPVDTPRASVTTAPESSKAPVLVAPPVSIPLEVSREKSKQSELISKAGNEVEPPGPGNPATNPQPRPASATMVEQKPANKQADVAQQKTAEQLWASREKLKQVELSKAANSAGPSLNNLELIQIPQKPVEVAPAHGEQSIETAPPLQAEPAVSLAQPADNFTLQLMVLSKQSSVDDIFKKHPAMASDIRVINVVVNGKEKFILEYGSYSDTVSANQARQSLPFEFRRALVRKVNSAKQR